MKANAKADAVELVEWLFDDLNNRSGFDTGGLDDDTLTEWKDAWVEQIEAALEQHAKEANK